MLTRPSFLALIVAPSARSNIVAGDRAGAAVLLARLAHA